MSRQQQNTCGGTQAIENLKLRAYESVFVSKPKKKERTQK